MSRRYQAGFISAGYNPLRVPNAPTIGTATDSKTDGSVSVAFTAPSCVGGGAITGYTAVANCGAKFASGSSSPITVTGLTNCTAYTFKVYANNTFGPSAYSAASNSVTPTKVVVGQQAYTTAGTYTWVAPAGVTSVSAVVVGGGGGRINWGCEGRAGGGGGALAYKNNISVTPGSSYTVIVGAASPSGTGGTSSFVNTSTVAAGGGTVGSSAYNGGTGGVVVAGTGYAGGAGGSVGGAAAVRSGAGGAGGYAGNGGAGGGIGSNGSAGAGGGGGGGAVSSSCYPTYKGGNGGGVGILGQGSNGAGGIWGGTLCVAQGSAGSSGSGATYGGGSSACAVVGGGGAVRIIWPGTTRQFPSTCTGDK